MYELGAILGLIVIYVLVEHTNFFDWVGKVLHLNDKKEK